MTLLELQTCTCQYMAGDLTERERQRIRSFNQDIDVSLSFSHNMLGSRWSEICSFSQIHEKKCHLAGREGGNIQVRRFGAPRIGDRRRHSGHRGTLVRSPERLPELRTLPADKDDCAERGREAEPTDELVGGLATFDAGLRHNKGNEMAQKNRSGER